MEIQSIKAFRVPTVPNMCQINLSETMEKQLGHGGFPSIT